MKTYLTAFIIVFLAFVLIIGGSFAISLLLQSAFIRIRRFTERSNPKKEEKE